ncbi:MAG: hypothetical protein OHK0053_12150 [Microscillaceae bacterium]
MSCSEGLEVTPNTQVKLLTGENSKTWILSKFTLQIEGETPIDVNEFFGIPACTQDDVVTFNRNLSRTYAFSEGATQCDPDDPNVFFEGGWNFSNATSLLTFSIPVFDGGNDTSYLVEELTSSKLKLALYDGTDIWRFEFDVVDED